jgi:hypothetical protein
MSGSPISHSPDLARLVHEGYAVEVRAGYLLVHDVPYVGPDKQVHRGVLISSLTTTVVNGEQVTAPPDTHVMEFAGAVPSDQAGSRLERLINGEVSRDLGSGIHARFSFSHKPPGSSGYPDNYEKVVAYVAMLGSHAAAIDADASACTFRVIECQEDGSPFFYHDTASARAGIGALSDKLKVGSIAIIGVGGTGSYLLDLLAKTHVAEIHLYDGDHFRVHNAFRAPGAASVADLDGGPNKAEHFAAVYGRMRRGVVAHAYDIEVSNVDELDGMSAVFLAVDPSPAKRAIIEWLEAHEIPFFDTGIGVDVKADALSGQVRLTAGLPGRPVSGRSWVPVDAPDGDAAIYATNVQVGELNALAAVLAVLRWKRHLGFYLDQQDEQHSVFTISGNDMVDDRC